MSGIFQQVMYELGIKQYKSSAYHPESQGALERFHQTLKNMIRSYCFDIEKDWDEGVHLLLFAVRESVQESLGFSPFELLFGHTVRGPLKLMKEKLFEDDSPLLNLLQYVANVKDKLEKVSEIARTNLKKAQNSMAEQYDKHAVRRSFVPGDKILAIFPVTGKLLQARFHGPYQIHKKIREVNYVVLTPDRRKEKQLCHINMLKPYVEREDCNESVHPISEVSVHEQSDDDLQDIGTPVKLENSQVLKDINVKVSHLSKTEQQDMKEILSEFNHLFPDIPTRTNQLHHDVDIGNTQPIKQHSYRLNPEKQKYLQKEIQYLLENDLIEPSKVIGVHHVFLYQNQMEVTGYVLITGK